MNRCGILLAGGLGSRLYPATKSISKHLLPVYDKPMIYYSLSTILKCGVEEVLIIAASQKDLLAYRDLLGDGGDLGVTLSYCVQAAPQGIAQAFTLGESFIAGRDVVLVLGDNIFYGGELGQILKSVPSGANIIFGCQVKNPTAYGVAEINEGGYVVGIEEKPSAPKSSWAIPGIYFYDDSVVEKTKTLSPSKRGELEITDLSLLYVKEKKLEFKPLYHTFWFDAGTHDSLLEASQFVKAVQSRTGEIIGNPFIN